MSRYKESESIPMPPAPNMFMVNFQVVDCFGCLGVEVRVETERLDVKSSYDHLRHARGHGFLAGHDDHAVVDFDLHGACCGVGGEE